jgi:hypothetical protein
MKKILALLLLLIGNSFAVDTVNVWKPTGADTLYSTAENWNQGRIPSVNDTIKFVGDTADRVCIIDVRTVKVRSILMRPSYTKNIAVVSGGITCAGFFRDSSNGGTLNLGTSIDTLQSSVGFSTSALLDAGTSTIVLNGAAAQTFIINGKALYDVKINRTVANTLTFSDSLKAHTVTIASGNTQAVTFSGPVVLSGDFLADGSGAVTHTLGVVANGASSQIHWGSTLGSTAVQDLTMNTATAGIIDADKFFQGRTLTLGASAVVTNSGASETYWNHSSTILTLGASAHFTLTRQIELVVSGAQICMSLGSGYIFDGSAFLLIITSFVGNITIPAFTRAGSGGLKIAQNSTAGNIFLGGDLNLGSGPLDVLTSSASLAMNLTTNNYAVNCGTFSPGGSSTGVCTINFGSSIFGCTLWAGSTYNNNATIKMDSSTITCAGNLVTGSNHTVVPGTSTINLMGGPAHIINHNNKHFYNLSIQKTVGAVDSCGAGTNLIIENNFTVDSGIFRDKGDSITTKNFYYNVDGSKFIGVTTVTNKLQIAAGKTLTLAALNIGGTTGAPDTLRSGTPGSAATIDPGVAVIDTIDSAIVIIDMTLIAGKTRYLPNGINGGGNSGAWIWPSSGNSLSGRQRRQNSMSVGIDFKQ